MTTHTNLVTAPSGRYIFGQPTTRLSWERGATVQVIELVRGTIQSPTPARYDADTIADMEEGRSLAIDFGANWSLSVEDTTAFIDYARDVLNKQLASA